MQAEDRPSRQTLLSSERGTIIKDWRNRTRVALVYPNRYHIGMSNLGFQGVYGIMNARDEVVCERVFLDEWGDRERHAPRSMESNQPLSRFDIVAFSISFENDYLNVVTLLARSGIPLLSRDRPAGCPLIMAGGVTCFLNPEPLAPLLDCVVIGEAEAVLPTFFTVFRAHATKEERLLALAAQVPGIYVPAFYTVDYEKDGTIRSFSPRRGAPQRVTHSILENLSAPAVCSTILTPYTTFADTRLIEAGRGCPHGCRFCAAGFVYRPPRFRKGDELEQFLDRERSESSKVGLVASAMGDIPSVEALCLKAVSQGLQISFSSFRADAISPGFLELLKQAGTKTATIAPDAGSERMRRVINKGISEDDVLGAVDALIEAGIANIKLYFMVGLPGETLTDVEAIVGLCKKVKHRFLKGSRRKARMGQITVSLNSFVPKPFTPFQWVPMASVRELRNRIGHVRRGLKKVANVKVHADLPKWAYVQALLSRGDRRTAGLLLDALANSGNWSKTLKESIVNPDFYVLRMRSLDELLPWDFIDNGIKKSFLIAEYERAKNADQTPPCLPGRCHLCGVCH